ncbi:MAG: hypothetical protein ACTSVI_07460 [Promethearchaeota archaeon]
MGKKKRVTEKKDDEEIEDVEDEDLDDSGEDFDDLDMPDEQENDESSADENIFDERSAIAKQFQVEEKEDITEERTYTVPLSRAYLRPPKKRAKRAINLIKKFGAGALKNRREKSRFVLPNPLKGLLLCILHDFFRYLSFFNLESNWLKYHEKY